MVRFLAVGCFFLVISSRLHSQENLADATSKERARVESLLARYSENRSLLQRYAAVFLCENTSTDLKRPENSAAADRWLAVSQSAQPGVDSAVLRYDQSLVRNGRTWYVSTVYSHTNRKIEQFLNGKRKELYNLAKDEADELALDFEFVRFDPWNLPFEGVAALQGRKHARLRNGQPELNWTGDRIISYQDLEGKISTKILIDAGNHIYLRITFSDRNKGLPEETSLVIEEPNGGWQGVMWTCKTDWVGHSDHGWLPASFVIRHSRGNPKRPSSLSEWKLTGYWVCDKDVPDELFQTLDGGICALDFPLLLEKVVQESVVPR